MTAPASSFDARHAYSWWLQLIRDEELYDAVIAGTHAELAGPRNLTVDDIAVLDAFRKERGLRWNIENLRFRAAAHVLGNLLHHMQRTLYLLTNADENWLQELVYEYLAHHHWEELGHEHLREAERFADYVRKRVLRRRIPPPHIDETLEFELALVHHLRRVKDVPPAEWPTRPEWSADQIADARPARAKTSFIHESAVDLTDWIKSADPRTGTVREQPISVLVVIPSPKASFVFQRLSPAVNEVYAAFDGTRTVREVATSLGDEYDIDDVIGLAGRWLRDGALTA